MEFPRPTKIIAVHVNYRSRAEQRGYVPDVPSYFLKPTSSIAADGEAVARPRGTELLAVEGEIAAIIGRRARHVTPSRGSSTSAGSRPPTTSASMTCAGPTAARTCFSKGQDGFTPLGEPFAADRFDPGGLTLRTRVNGSGRPGGLEREPDLPVRPARSPTSRAS